ncbi:MAG: 16S rRNA (cytidine(1402)-2'-O)-methyltransferase [Ignavibacteriae bacterium]|nr:16S rRNA (cytidine(1402)-2'-O)-methyltransferase [Ignavibacteriota bacterium]MCB9219291.1 16S rRNA (cytidine(1402)-2'-O)-methyltransferase [Ignavibacteriales bacterium]MCB9260177.1 16S rRNA (cytidine(1402)-2'-O)-methyltransferase [Ignavibacteriales bacterium]
MKSGSLYIIATPIGNLEDITFRAVNILKEVNLIACEDTRVTKILLDKYEVKNELFSLNAQSENHKLGFLIDRILKGENCALVSDAGTPTISDPGVRLVNEAIKNNIEVIGIPGANAAILALSISGLPTDAFIYEGFLPQKKGRQKKIKQLAEEDRTIVLYESTYRIEKLLNELNEYMPERYVVVQRELTKKFEESWRGYPIDLISDIPNKITKGEFVIIIAPKNWI